MNYAKPLAILAIFGISAGSIYAFTYKTPEERIRESIITENKQIEERNIIKIKQFHEEVRKCEDSATGSSFEVAKKQRTCRERPYPEPENTKPVPPIGSGGSIEGVSKNNDNVEINCPELYMSGSEIVSPRNGVTFTFTKNDVKELYPKCKIYNVEKSTATVSDKADPPIKIVCTIGTGSHDVRPLAKNYPGVSGWKNNSVSGLSMGSKDLEKAFNEAGIKWYVGTYRPANEGSRYYGFTDLENGMRAKLLVIKRSYKNATIKSYLKIWGTDSIVTSLDTSRKISSLSDSELISLIRSQITKESGKAMSDYVFKNVLTCK